jgi:hypothetical protein
MNTEERVYRFGEIMSAVGLLPDLDMSDEVAEAEAEGAQEWLLPNLTKGVSDVSMTNAILCQVQRENTEWKFKLIALLTNSAMQGLNESAEYDKEPSKDDIYAIAICANVLWGEGQVKGLYQLLGLLSGVCSRFDMKVPELATVFLRPNDGVETFGKLDPIALLQDELSLDDVREILNQDGE